MDGCLFCRIAKREVGAHVVHEDRHLLAFLDICPIRPGHTQIITRDHFDYFDATPPDLVCAIAVLGQKLAAAMKRRYGVPRVAFLFTGGDVMHVHAHVVPMLEKTDITSRRYFAEEALTFRGMPRAADTDLVREASALRDAIV